MAKSRCGVAVDRPRPASGIEERLLDRRIGEMRHFAALMAEGTASDRLQALRRSYPDVPLSMRVEAATRGHR